MARILDDDIALVRERADLAEIVSSRVTLRNAGSGNMKGLCPFHDEKTPSFTVSTSKNMYMCHGCGQGGDAIRFVMETEHLDFVDAIRHLAAVVGITLREEESSEADKAAGRLRSKALQAHRLAEEFYAEQLISLPEAQIAREFLQGRGFTREHADAFKVGYASHDRKSLLAYLQSAGIGASDARDAGLATEGARGVQDRFHSRVLWPIRDQTGQTIGFGARQLYDDDTGPKYLNTPETLLYKKSKVLFGLDLARRDIAKQRRVVIVEGYTDVMACYVAGIPVAVATCGTAFGDEHVRMLRRLLHDDDPAGSEVVFTFDGDKAGQAAALKAFHGGEAQFTARTFAAVEPRGMDPCELRLADGDQAVVDLIAAKTPLAEFALRKAVHGDGSEDLNHPEARATALNRALPLLASIGDAVLREGYSRRVAEWLGLGPDAVRSRLASAAARPPAARPAAVSPAAPAAPGTPAARPPVAGDGEPAPPAASAVDVGLDREATKLAIQHPAVLAEALATAGWCLADLLVDETARAIASAVETTGGLDGSADLGASWIPKVTAALDPRFERSLAACAIEPVFALVDEPIIEIRFDPTADHAKHVVRRLMTRQRDISIAALMNELRSPGLPVGRRAELMHEIVSARSRQ